MTAALGRILETRACSVCGRVTARRPTLKQLRACEECGFVDYEASESEIASLYDDAYFHGGDYPDYMGQEQNLRRSMRRHLTQMKRCGCGGGALMEVGCAYGLFLDEAKRVGFAPVVGVDVCAGPVAYARDTLGLDARCADLGSAGLRRASFDVACMWDTVEHISRPDLVLSQVFNLLKPGGTLFLTTGDLGSLSARVRRSQWRQIHPPTHLNYFTRSTIAALLHRLGFTVSGFETAAYYHSAFNVLATVALRSGTAGKLASRALRWIGESRARKMGCWVNLLDIMFVAAERPA